MPTRRRADRWHRWWGLVVLVVLVVVRATFAEARPEINSTLGSATAGCGAAAVGCWLWGGRGGRSIDGRAALAGAMLLCGPLLGLVVGTPLEANSLVIALALVPVVVGVAATGFGQTTSQSLAGRVWPGLAAVAGLLLLLPEPSFASTAKDLLLGLSPVVTGVGAAMFCSRSFEGGALPGKATAALSGAGLVFGLALVVTVVHTHGVPGFSLLATLFDGMLASLAVMTLVRLGATRWSAVFALGPLVVLVEAIVLLRPKMDVRWVVGLGLLGVAALFLLLPQTDDGDVEAVVAD